MPRFLQQDEHPVLFFKGQADLFSCCLSLCSHSITLGTDPL